MKRAILVMIAAGSIACGSPQPPVADTRARNAPASTSPASQDDRKYLLEQIDDAAVVQLYADGFGALPIKEKTLVWHLYQAAIAGRDIYYDQRYAQGLEMRDVL